ncbi:hypothetical protein COO60DRAFT_1059034 [Scenedesmus sp. NREL 46B-D3]|nr:hypothetical protein COO60DRAFT_1059034 [Scenedesmus sp. NREL 46B-D3]
MSARTGLGCGCSLQTCVCVVLGSQHYAVTLSFTRCAVLDQLHTAGLQGTAFRNCCSCLGLGLQIQGGCIHLVVLQWLIGCCGWVCATWFEYAGVGAGEHARLAELEHELGWEENCMCRHTSIAQLACGLASTCAAPCFVLHAPSTDLVCMAREVPTTMKLASVFFCSVINVDNGGVSRSAGQPPATSIVCAANTCLLEGLGAVLELFAATMVWLFTPGQVGAPLVTAGTCRWSPAVTLVNSRFPYAGHVGDMHSCAAAQVCELLQQRVVAVHSGPPSALPPDFYLELHEQLVGQ